MSDFRHLPTQDEVRRYDRRWIDDMKLAHTLYAHQGDNSFEMLMMEKLEAAKQRKDMGLPPEDGDDDGDDSGLIPLGEAPKPKRPRR